jgi:hypothetical protein
MAPANTNVEFSLAEMPEPQAAWDRKSLKPWHHELLERMVLDPTASLKDHAKALGKHEVTVGQVARSDMFLAKLEELRGQRERLMVLEIDAKMDQTITKGLDRVHEAVSKKDCDPGFALSAVVSLDKQRRGTKVGPGASFGVNIAIDAGDLAHARTLIQAHARSENGNNGNSDQLLEILQDG